MSLTIALVGNPNSGKTTLFNQLTGANQHVGNWPGVTVEKKEGKLKNHKDALIIDLPGVYSLSPYSLEEVIARQYLIDHHPDVIINIVDGTNLERNLYLTTQLMEMGTPMVVAVNRIDVLRSQNQIIDYKKLESALHVHVVPISALNKEGIDELIQVVNQSSKEEIQKSSALSFSKPIENALSMIHDIISPYVETHSLRWVTIKLLEGDQEAIKSIHLPDPIATKVTQTMMDSSIQSDDIEMEITKERYAFIRQIIKNVMVSHSNNKEKLSDRIDKIVTNKWAALPIFAAIIFLVYYLAISTIGGIMTDYVNEVVFGDGGIPDIVGGWLESIGIWPWLQSLLVEGIIAGVGAVLGFLPQMLVLFLLLGLLEESGYMARIAFILDRVFRRFGLSGKSFIPMLISTGCAIPGVMAARTIEDEHNRKMTIMTTSFMPCGAKLPIIALIAGALFENSAMGWIVGPSAYFIGIGAIIISGIILKKFKAFAGDPAPFIMELPDYHLPQIKSLSMHVWNKLKSFIAKAGTIILSATVLVWLLSSLSFTMHWAESIDDSILAGIGKFIDVFFVPLGWGHWQAAVATFMGLIAKENVVSTFGILYGFAEVSEDGVEIWSLIARDFTQLSAYSFLVFNLICAPCFAAIGAIRREMGSRKWTWIAVGYQTGLAYILSLIIYQLGMMFSGTFNFGTIVALLALGGMIYLLVRKNKFLTATSRL